MPATEPTYALEDVTTAMGAALKGVDPDAEFARLWRIFIDATIERLKAQTTMRIVPAEPGEKLEPVYVRINIASPND